MSHRTSAIVRPTFPSKTFTVRRWNQATAGHGLSEQPPNGNPYSNSSAFSTFSTLSPERVFFIIKSNHVTHPPFPLKIPVASQCSKEKVQNPSHGLQGHCTVWPLHLPTSPAPSPSHLLLTLYFPATFWNHLCPPPSPQGLALMPWRVLLSPIPLPLINSYPLLRSKEK